MSNNPPHAMLELTQEEYEFLDRNCESNIAFALNALSNVGFEQATAEAIIATMEQFKNLREKLHKSKL